MSLEPGQPWQVDRMNQNLECTVPNKPFELDLSKISDHTFVHKQLTVVEQSMDSNEREMLAAYCLISSSVELLQNKTVVLHMDNLNASNICLKGSSKFKLQKYAIKISDICQQFSINLQTVWIPRSLNRFADKMSKLTDIEDFTVSTVFFETVERLSGLKCTFDRFANSVNKKTQIQ